MPSDKVDVAVVLGGQILRKETSEGAETTLAAHTRMRAEAALAAYRKGLAKFFIICGGHCFGVRYDPETNEILSPPNFSFEAMARASAFMSEARAIKLYIMAGEDAVPEENVIVEELSTTTADSAQCAKIILSHTLAGELEGSDPSRMKKVGVITHSSHMKRALEEFRKVGIDAIAMRVEHLLEE